MLQSEIDVSSSEMSQAVTNGQPKNKREELPCTSSDCPSNQSESSEDSRGRLSALEVELQARTRDLERLKFKIDKMKTQQLSSTPGPRRESKPINIKIEVERLKKDKKVMAELLKQSQQELAKKDSVNRKLKQENDKLQRTLVSLQGKLAENGRNQHLLDQLEKVRNELSLLTNKTDKLECSYQEQPLKSQDKNQIIEELVMEKEQLKQCLSAIYFKITPYAGSFPYRDTSSPVWTEDIKNTFEQFWEEKIKLQRELDHLRLQIKSRGESPEDNKIIQEDYETTVSDDSTESKTDCDIRMNISEDIGENSFQPAGIEGSELCRWKEMYQMVYDKYKMAQHTLADKEKKLDLIYSSLEEMVQKLVGQENLPTRISSENVIMIIRDITEECLQLKECLRKVRNEEKLQIDLQSCIIDTEKILAKEGRTTSTLKSVIGRLNVACNLENKVASYAETMLKIYTNQLEWIKQLEHNNKQTSSTEGSLVGDDIQTMSPVQAPSPVSVQNLDKPNDTLGPTCDEELSCSSESNESNGACTVLDMTDACCRTDVPISMMENSPNSQPDDSQLEEVKDTVECKHIADEVEAIPLEDSQQIDDQQISKEDNKHSEEVTEQETIENDVQDAKNDEESKTDEVNTTIVENEDIKDENNSMNENINCDQEIKEQLVESVEENVNNANENTENEKNGIESMSERTENEILSETAVENGENENVSNNQTLDEKCGREICPKNQKDETSESKTVSESQTINENSESETVSDKQTTDKKCECKAEPEVQQVGGKSENEIILNNQTMDFIEKDSVESEPNGVKNTDTEKSENLEEESTDESISSKEHGAENENLDVNKHEEIIDEESEENVDEEEAADEEETKDDDDTQNEDDKEDKHDDSDDNSNEQNQLENVRESSDENNIKDDRSNEKKQEDDRVEDEKTGDKQTEHSVIQNDDQLVKSDTTNKEQVEEIIKEHQIGESECVSNENKRCELIDNNDKNQEPVNEDSEQNEQIETTITADIQMPKIDVDNSVQIPISENNKENDQTENSEYEELESESIQSSEKENSENYIESQENKSFENNSEGEINVDVKSNSGTTKADESNQSTEAFSSDIVNYGDVNATEEKDENSKETTLEIQSSKEGKEDITNAQDEIEEEVVNAVFCENIIKSDDSKEEEIEITENNIDTEAGQDEDNKTPNENETIEGKTFIANNVENGNEGNFTNEIYSDCESQYEEHIETIPEVDEEDLDNDANKDETIVLLQKASEILESSKIIEPKENEDTNNNNRETSEESNVESLTKEPNCTNDKSESDVERNHSIQSHNGNCNQCVTSDNDILSELPHCVVDNTDNDIKIVINSGSSEGSSENESDEQISLSAPPPDLENGPEDENYDISSAEFEKTDQKENNSDPNTSISINEELIEKIPAMEPEIIKIVVKPKEAILFSNIENILENKENNRIVPESLCTASKAQEMFSENTENVEEKLTKKIEELETEMSEMQEVKQHHMQVACNLAEQLEEMKKRESDLREQLAITEKCTSQEVEGMLKEWIGREQSYQDEIAAWKENVQQQNSVLQRLKADLDHAQQLVEQKDGEIAQLRKDSKGEMDNVLETETQTSDHEDDQNSKELKETVEKLRKSSEHYQQQLLENRTVVREVKSIIEGSVAQLVTLKAMGTKHMKREYIYRNNLVQREQELKNLQMEMDKQAIDSRTKGNVIEKQKSDIRILKEEVRKYQNDLSAKIEYIDELQAKIQNFVISETKEINTKPEERKLSVIGEQCIEQQHIFRMEKQREEVEKLQGQLNQLEMKCRELESPIDMSDQSNQRSGSHPGSAGSASSTSEEINSTDNLCLCKRKDVNKILKLSEESYLNLLASLIVCLGIPDLKYNKSLLHLSWAQCKDIMAERKANQKKIIKIIQVLKREERKLSPRPIQTDRIRRSDDEERRKSAPKAISPPNGQSVYISDMIKHAEESFEKDKLNKTDTKKSSSWRPLTSNMDRRIPLELKNGEILALLGNADPKSVPKAALSSK